MYNVGPLGLVRCGWPGITRDMGRYVEGCNLCQRMKNKMEEVAGKLKLSEIPRKR